MSKCDNKIEVFISSLKSASYGVDKQWKGLMIMAQGGDEKAYAELLEAIYPAIKASQLNPIDALHSD